MTQTESKCAFLFHADNGNKFIGLSEKVLVKPEKLTLFVKEALKIKPFHKRIAGEDSQTRITNISFSFDLPSRRTRELKHPGSEDLLKRTYHFENETLTIYYTEKSIDRVKNLVSKKC